MKSIYDSHVRYLTAVCLRYIPDADEAKDILQESFIKVFSSIGSFRGGDEALRAWMRKIVVNEALMHLRRRSREPVLLGNDALPLDVPDEDPDPESIPPDVLQQMIMRLPEGYRTIFNLYVFERRSHKEIARMLGIKENTSTSQYHRAKGLMASMIKDYRDAQRLER